MRTTLFILLLMTLTTGCTKWTPPPAKHRTLVIDKSNRHLLQTVGEDIPEILESLRPEDLWNAVDFRVVSLGAVAYNRATEIELPAEDPDEGNPLARKRRMEAFLDRVAEIIRLSIGEPRDDSASVVYLPLALEFERLAGCGGEIIIYSDLIEHLGKGKWSLYDDGLLDSLQRAPDAFVRHFEQQRVLPDLSDLTISVVNIPRNTPNSMRVSTVYAWYERLWTAKDARVSIAGNYHCKLKK